MNEEMKKFIFTSAVYIALTCLSGDVQSVLGRNENDTGINNVRPDSSNIDCDADNSSQSQTILYILSLLPYPDDQGREDFQPSWDEGPTLFLVEQLAVELINNRSDILGGYTVELLRGDTGCNIRSKANQAFFEKMLYSDNAPVGIVGPGCSNSALTVSALTGRQALSILTIHVAGSLLLSDRSLYEYSFGTLDSTDVFIQASLALMRKNGWEPVAMLYDESREYYASTARRFENDLRSAEIVHFSSAVYDTFIPLDVIINSRTRVIFLLVGPDFLSRILCLAHHSNITYPIYQFVIVSRVVEEIQPITFVYNGDTISCTRENMTQVTNGSLIIHYQLKSSEKVTESGLSYVQFFDLYKELVAEYNKRNKLFLGNKTTMIEPSFWAASFFDAVWSMALALNASIEKTNIMSCKPCNRADILRESLREQNFSGLSGRIMYNHSSGYVIRNVNVYQIDSNRQMNLIAFYAKLNDSIVLTSTNGKFINGRFQIESTIYAVPLVVGVIFLSITAVCFIVTLILHTLTIVYRKQKSVKASSTKLSYVAFTGCYVFAFAGLMNFIMECLSNVISPSSVCHLFHILNSAWAIGGTLLFGPICARTWRLYRIYVHFNDPGKLISDRFLLTVVVILLALNVFVSITWITVDPFEPGYRNVSHLGKVLDTQGNAKEIVAVETAFVECSLSGSRFYLWFGILFMFVVCLMLIAFLLAVLTRNIPHRDFQTQSIMLLVYLQSGLLLVGLLLYFIFRIHLLQFIVLNVLLNQTMLFSCLLLFLPPLYPLMKQKRLFSLCLMYCH